MNESNMIVGIAWYRPEQYGLLRALAADTDSMANTYEEWLAGVTKTNAASSLAEWMWRLESWQPGASGVAGLSTETHERPT